VAPPTAGVQTHVEVVIDVINNTPLPVESAALEMKGKIRAAPLLVSYCTNYPHAQLRGRCLDPLPFFRRFPIRARVAVKPQYSTPSGAVDKDKAKAAGSHDLWDLHVSRYDTTHYDPQAPFSAAPYSVPEVMSFPAFCILMKKEFRKHISEQRELLGRKMRGEIDRCPNCGLPTDLLCGCVGGKVAAPSDKAAAAEIDHAKEFAGVEVELQGKKGSMAVLEEESSDSEVEDYPIFVRHYSSVSNCFRRLCHPRRMVEELIDDLRERARGELAVLAGKLIAGSALLIAAGALVIKLIGSYGTTLQSREPAASWLGVPSAWQRPATDFSPGLPPLIPNPTFTED